MTDCNVRAAIPEEERTPYFFSDPRPPNKTGHKLYADMIQLALRAIL
jgi:hypothetical protein